MRKFLTVMTFLVLTPLLLLGTTATAASIVKVGVVDLQKALNATTEGVAAKETLRKKHQLKQEEIDVMREELEQLEQRMKSPVISEQALADLKEQHRQKKLEIIEFARNAKEEEDKENTMLSAKILDGLMEIVREIGREENYTMILERNGSGVIYFPDTLDITEEAVRIYNQRSQTGAGN